VSTASWLAAILVLVIAVVWAVWQGSKNSSSTDDSG
jgi:hypothetical protein